MSPTPSLRWVIALWQPWEHLPRGNQHPGLGNGQSLQAGPIQSGQCHPSSLPVASLWAGGGAHSCPRWCIRDLSADHLRWGSLPWAPDGACRVWWFCPRARWWRQLAHSRGSHVLACSWRLKGPSAPMDHSCLDAHHQNTLWTGTGWCRGGGGCSRTDWPGLSLRHSAGDHGVDEV